MPDKFLSRDDILGADDLPSEVVEVAAWGGAVRVRGLTAAQRDHFEASILDKKGNVKTENIRAKLCALCIVGDDNEPLFTDSDIAKLSKKSAQAVDGLFSVAQRLSGMSRADVEELEKNSG